MDGEELRDRGIALVSKHAGIWMPLAIHIVTHFPNGWEGAGEDVRYVVDKIIGPPHVPQAWGALIRTVGSSKHGRNIIYEIGRYTKMRDPRSHARRTTIYRKG